MFSQSSFRPLESQRSGAPFEIYNPSPSGSTLVTPQTSGQITPVEVEDDFQLDSKRTNETIQVQQPVPKLHISEDQPLLPSMSSPSQKTHRSSGSFDRQFSKSLDKDPFLDRPPNRTARLSPSPSRPHLNALSPLQGLSPLHTTRPLAEQNVNATSSESGRSRANSLTRSLSRRQSLIASAEEWDKKRDDEDNDPRGNAMNLFSRITLVKAPVEQSGLRRAKSSSSISPFSAGRSLDGNASATTARGPRRSFAASSFAGFSPMTGPGSPKSLKGPFSPRGPDTAGRITQLHDRTGSDTSGVQRKTMSPEEVLDVARGLASPVVIPEGGFKGAELKRRKSAGATSRRGTTDSPEKPPLALEPVEYVQLDEDTLLPFVDRPQEVNELMQHPSNASLFKLLKAAFPKDPVREHWQALAPEQWCWDEFVQHLTSLKRSDCPDYPWIFRARQAVRARSVALWEKLGVCLGCDGDLLNAGGEDGSPPSWAGLSLGEEGEYDPSASQVWIEGLQGVDSEEAARIERQLKEEFGDIVEDEGEQAAAGMTALLGTLGEEPEEISPRPTQTAAQREGNRKVNPVDPMNSPTFTMGSLPREFAHSPYTPRSHDNFVSASKSRSKSFVGLQILTSPIAHGSFGKAIRSPHLGHDDDLPIYDRGPGSPLFPSSFSSLSVEPNLGRSASVALPAGQVKPIAAGFGGDAFGMGIDTSRWSGIRRKASGAGLSESAITFASESDYSHSIPGDHDRHL